MKFPFKKGKKMTEQTQIPETENPETTPETEVVEEVTIESLQERIAELEGMLKDEQLRGLANEQNLRRRHQEEIQAAHKFAAQRFAAEMLTVKDYLEMALLDQSGNFDAMKMGVSMTLNELQKAFDATQIQEIASEKGSKLDPHRHQAMHEVEAEQEAGTIVGVLKKGYTMHDRVLRPAMVTVAKAAE
ncbi:nucleotide exchange factor GrpE [Wielerella bovis]|nr:nucleotide exchange factor GrpE [Wielerella bovis]ULJ63574.1 nucleotide exchange factor GrpE [Wielerella bovis]